MNKVMMKEHRKIMRGFEDEIADADLDVEERDNIVALLIPFKEILEVQVEALRNAIVKKGAEVPTVATATVDDLAALNDKLVKVASGATMLEERREMLEQQKEARIKETQNKNRIKRMMTRASLIRK